MIEQLEFLPMELYKLVTPDVPADTIASFVDILPFSQLPCPSVCERTTEFPQVPTEYLLPTTVPMLT